MKIHEIFNLNKKNNPFKEEIAISLKNSFKDIDNLFLDRKNIFNSNIIFKTFSDEKNNKVKLLWKDYNYDRFFNNGKSFKNNILIIYLNQLGLNIENDFIPIFIFQNGNENRLYFYKNEIIIFLNNKINDNIIKNMIFEIFKIFEFNKTKNLEKYK